MSDLIHGMWGLIEAYDIVSRPQNNENYWNGSEWMNTVRPFSDNGRLINIHPETAGRAVITYQSHNGGPKYIGVDFDKTYNRVYVEEKHLKRIL